MNAVRIPGLRPDTLSGYLAALGLFRAVQRCLDGNVRASWDGHLVLHCDYSTVEELVAALSAGFAPAAVVSPWNAGAGFTGNGKNSTAESLLAWVRSSDDDRLAELRAGVAAGDEVVRQARERGLIAEDGTLAKDAKQQLLLLCDNEFPDAALPWFEAATTLHGDDEVAFSRLLGTGGNFGRQDLCATYLARTRAVFTERRCAAWLRALLTGDESVPYLRDAVGQFDPGRAGGIQSSILEKADDKGFVNPWSFLLTVEGTLLFASAVSRTQGSQRSRAVLPFQVRGSTSGYPHAADGERPLGELWAPEWSGTMALPALRQLLGEGRADWNGRTAGSGLDFVRAVASLGVDRGVTAFHRFLFVDRLGQNPLAVPAGRVPVAEQDGVRLLAGLDQWRNRLHSDLSAAVDSALARLDDANFRYARSGTAADLVELFVALGRAHDAVSRSGAAREKAPPLVLRTGPDLLGLLRSRESDVDLRVALALASMRDRSEAAARWPGTAAHAGRRAVAPSVLRPLLSPVGIDPARGTVAWTGRPAPVAATGDLGAAVLAAARLRAQRAPEDDLYAEQAAAPPGARGVLLAPEFGGRLPLRDLELFGSAGFDEERTALLLAGLLCVDFTGATQRPSEVNDLVVDAGLAMLSLFALPWPVAVTTPDGGTRKSVLRANRAWPSWLQAGRVVDVLADATQRLRLAGFRHVITPHSTAAPAALAAALLIPPQTVTAQHTTAPVRRLLARFTDADSSDIRYCFPPPPSGTAPAQDSEEIPA